MRRLARRALLAAAIGLIGCAPKPAAAPVAAGGATGAPAWLKPYSAQQEALLAPVREPIHSPTERVFPDLERFGYAVNKPMTDLAEPLKFTRMIATVITESPRFYALGEAPADLANLVTQYGPEAAREPDGWSIARRAGDGGVLERVKDAAIAVPDFQRGQALVAAHKPDAAAAAYVAAAQKSPRVPAVYLALGRALSAAGHATEAAAAYRSGVAVDRTYAPLYLGLSELAEARQDQDEARRELAEALAYNPPSEAANAAARRLGGAGTNRVRPMSIFLDVDSVGAIHVGTGAGIPAQIYGGCRAVMRFEPEVRSAMYEQPLDTPYYLSVVEEVVCLEASIGAYLFDRTKNPSAVADPEIDRLIDVAGEDGLAGYAMFEILGQRRPERARLAPDATHKAVVAYVLKHVLGDAEPPPTGVYTASR
jgi:tetratricopeptide (TPR) repeat protein